MLQGGYVPLKDIDMSRTLLQAIDYQVEFRGRIRCETVENHVSSTGPIEHTVLEQIRKMLRNKDLSQRQDVLNGCNRKRAMSEEMDHAESDRVGQTPVKSGHGKCFIFHRCYIQ